MLTALLYKKLYAVLSKCCQYLKRVNVSNTLCPSSSKTASKPLHVHDCLRRRFSKSVTFLTSCTMCSMQAMPVILSNSLLQWWEPSYRNKLFFSHAVTLFSSKIISASSNTLACAQWYLILKLFETDSKCLLQFWWILELIKRPCVFYSQSKKTKYM